MQGVLRVPINPRPLVTLSHWTSLRGWVDADALDTISERGAPGLKPAGTSVSGLKGKQVDPGAVLQHAKEEGWPRWATCCCIITLRVPKTTKWQGLSRPTTNWEPRCDTFKRQVILQGCVSSSRLEALKPSKPSSSLGADRRSML